MSKVLIGEINGMQVHLSLTSPGSRPQASVCRDCSTVEELDALLDEFMNEAGKPQLIAGAFCAPGPVRNDSIQLTYADMKIDRPRLRGVLGTSRIHLVNDFTACALAVPLLDPAEIEQVGGVDPVHEAPIGVVGPWRGLGVSTLAPDADGQWFPLSGEGGHIVVAATNDREAEVLSVMRKALGRISAEEVVTEPGLVNLQSALAHLASARPLGDVNTILAAAAEGEATADEAISLFTGWMGDIAGNLVLTVGARGGLYICSPLMSANPALFDRSLLRSRFEDKGRMRSYMEEVPLFLVSTAQIGLLGLSTLFTPTDARRN